eukprot:1184885-Prorocentrum_minimum.AAC.1
MCRSIDAASQSVCRMSTRATEGSTRTPGLQTRTPEAPETRRPGDPEAPETRTPEARPGPGSGVRKQLGGGLNSPAVKRHLQGLTDEDPHRRHFFGVCEWPNVRTRVNQIIGGRIEISSGGAAPIAQGVGVALVPPDAARFAPPGRGRGRSRPPHCARGTHPAAPPPPPPAQGPTEGWGGGRDEGEDEVERTIRRLSKMPSVTTSMRVSRETFASCRTRYPTVCPTRSPRVVAMRVAAALACTTDAAGGHQPALEHICGNRPARRSEGRRKRTSPGNSPSDAQSGVVKLVGFERGELWRVDTASRRGSSTIMRSLGLSQEARSRSTSGKQVVLPAPGAAWIGWIEPNGVLFNLNGGLLERVVVVTEDSNCWRSAMLRR